MITGLFSESNFRLFCQKICIRCVLAHRNLFSCRWGSKNFWIAEVPMQISISIRETDIVKFSLYLFIEILFFKRYIDQIYSDSCISQQTLDLFRFYRATNI